MPSSGRLRLENLIPSLPTHLPHNPLLCLPPPAPPARHSRLSFTSNSFTLPILSYSITPSPLSPQHCPTALSLAFPHSSLTTISLPLSLTTISSFFYHNPFPVCHYNYFFHPSLHHFLHRSFSPEVFLTSGFTRPFHPHIILSLTVPLHPCHPEHLFSPS